MIRQPSNNCKNSKIFRIAKIGIFGINMPSNSCSLNCNQTLEEMCFPIKLYLFVILAAVSVSSKFSGWSPNNGARIYGGDVAKIDRFPYQASLRRRYGREEFNHICGASIITTTFLITAAHCKRPVIEELMSAIYFISVGFNERDENNYKLYRLKEFIVHGEFNKTFYQNDIALIELYEPLTFSDTVAPIAINYDFIDGAVEAVFSGYGQSEVSVKFVYYIFYY